MWDTTVYIFKQIINKYFKHFLFHSEEDKLCHLYPTQEMVQKRRQHIVCITSCLQPPANHIRDSQETKTLLKWIATNTQIPAKVHTPHTLVGIFCHQVPRRWVTHNNKPTTKKLLEFEFLLIWHLCHQGYDINVIIVICIKSYHYYKK